MEQGDSFLTQYLHYVGDTEAPIFYHRWAAISAIGAYLGRQYSFTLGHSALYTNMYIMLIGEPGSRKSTAIKIAKKTVILAAAGNWKNLLSRKNPTVINDAKARKMEIIAAIWCCLKMRSIKSSV